MWLVGLNPGDSPGATASPSLILLVWKKSSDDNECAPRTLVHALSCRSGWIQYYCIRSVQIEVNIKVEQRRLPFRTPNLDVRRCAGSDHVAPLAPLSRPLLLVRGKRERTTRRVLPELSSRDGLFRARLVRLTPLSGNVTMQLRPRLQWRGLRDPRVCPVVPVQLLVASWSVYKVAQGRDSALRVRRRFQWRWMRRPHARKLL